MASRWKLSSATARSRTAASLARSWAREDSFLCAAKGVSVGIAFNKKIGAGFFGGEGFIMERLQGDGWAFLNAGGNIYERVLAPGKVLRVDTGCIVGFQPSVAYDIQY